MSTSFLSAPSIPLRSGRVVEQSRRACFGEYNRLSDEARSTLEVMEWHPETSSGQKQAKDCREFISSFGFWKDVYRVTTLNGVAADIRDKPADLIITGFMAARNFSQRQYEFLADGGSFPEGTTYLDSCRYSFLASVIGGSVGAFGFNYTDPRNGESGLCRLLEEDDAYGLYLLAFGSKEECEGAFFQHPLFTPGTPNDNGYLRDDHRTTARRMMREMGYTPQQIEMWRSMSDWLRLFLTSSKAQASGKLGRLTVGQFISRHSQRGNDITTFVSMFEELKDMYS